MQDSNLYLEGAAGTKAWADDLSSLVACDICHRRDIIGGRGRSYGSWYSMNPVELWNKKEREAYLAWQQAGYPLP